MRTTIDLDFHPPFAAAPALAMLASHAVPGAEIVHPATGTVVRLLRTPSGQVPLTVTVEPSRITVSLDSATPERAELVGRTVRQWLDLDARPERVVAALGTDPTLGPLVRARPGLRVIGHPDGFEAAVLTVLGQQVSVAAGRTFGGRLARAYGTSQPSGLIAFPTPDRLAAVEPEELRRTLGVTHARSRALHALVTACADGLDIRPDGDHQDIRRRLLALPGIGPWTVDYLAVRVLGDRDAYPAGDLVLRRALGVTSATAARDRAQRWSPYRAYAVFHLWAHAAWS